MTKKPAETTEEAAQLAKLFESVDNRAQFARDHSVPGGQAGIYQHITGNRPISLEAAIAYASGFKCSLREISPRWADLVTEASKYTKAPIEETSNTPSMGRSKRAPWPFRSVSYDEYLILSESKKRQLEDRVAEFIVGATPASKSDTAAA